jgi:hypothetical protein
MADTKITGLTAHTTLIDTDVLPVVDITAGATKKTTWSNIKSVLKTYFDTLYAPVLGANDNYVTDAEKTVIGNTSGANTGDNATNTQYSGLAASKAEVAGSTGQVFSVSSLEVGNADTTVSRSGAGVIAVEGVVIPSISSTNTLTNKRVTKRTGTTTSHATPTINTDNVDFYSLTAQAEAITSFTTNLSGTPTEAQTLIIRIKDNGTARAITWGASFAAMGVALPTTTVISKVLTVGFIYDTVATKWGCIASAQEA